MVKVKQASANEARQWLEDNPNAVCTDRHGHLYRCSLDGFKIQKRHAEAEPNFINWLYASMQEEDAPFFITEDDIRQQTFGGVKIEAIPGLDEDEVTTVETLVKERNELREQVSKLKQCRESALKRAHQSEKKVIELQKQSEELRAQIINRTKQRDLYIEQRNEALGRAAKYELKMHQTIGEDDKEKTKVFFYPFPMFSPKPYHTCVFRYGRNGDYFFGHTMTDGSVRASVGNASHVKLKETSNLYFAQIEESEETDD